MDRRTFVTGAAASIVTEPAVTLMQATIAEAAIPPRPLANPNAPLDVVLVVSDDLFDWLQFQTYFGISIKTPNIDAFLARSTRFAHMRCVATVCKPARGGIYSGLTPYQTGLFGNDDPWPNQWLTADKMIYRYFKQAGYRVVQVGKGPHHANLRDTPCSPDIDAYHQAQWSLHTYVDDDNVPVMINQIRNSQRVVPTLFSFGLEAPHVPYTTKWTYLGMYPLSQIVIPHYAGSPEPQWIVPWLDRATYNTLVANGTLGDHIRAYLASVSNMDADFGQIVANLDASGRRYVLAFTSDQGFELGDHNHIGKLTLYDPVASVPFIVYDPEAMTFGNTITDIVSALDVLPTLLDYAGLQPSADMLGRSLRPMILNPAIRRTEGALTMQQGSLAFRRDGYVYNLYEDGEEQFFVTAKDPLGANNLIASARWQSIIANMRTQSAAMLADWKGPNPVCRSHLPPQPSHDTCPTFGAARPTAPR